jgi:hypothetical protein
MRARPAESNLIKKIKWFSDGKKYRSEKEYVHMTMANKYIAQEIPKYY